MTPKKPIVFDLGGVLIDWNPAYLYRSIFSSEKEVTWFLENVCTSEWNEKQDAGRPFAEAVDELVARFPAHEEAIRAWVHRWDETMGGAKEETVRVLRSLHSSGHYRLYALTNWSAETFPWALKRFDFLQWFDGIVVSGTEKTLKPNPDFYQILFDRYAIDPRQAVFIDDNLKNIEAARRLGMTSIHFTEAIELPDELSKLGIEIRGSESK
ncbi:MAG: HAD family phosphatase [Cytophagales bacterium]|nr:HAD family phosphatase [Cytophagales bacterium]